MVLLLQKVSGRVNANEVRERLVLVSLTDGAIFTEGEAQVLPVSHLFYSMSVHYDVDLC